MSSSHLNMKSQAAFIGLELRTRAFPNAITLIDNRRKALALEQEAKAFKASRHKDSFVKRRGNIRGIILA